MISLLLVILIVIKNFSLIYATASTLRVTPSSLLQKLTDGNNRSRYWY